MTREPTNSTNTVVVGASRGLGRGIATALAKRGRQVTAIARDADALATLADDCGVIPEIGDATDPALVARVVARRPAAVVMVAGVRPWLGSLSEYTWDALSAPWQVDVQAAFRWIQAALRAPLDPGAKVVIVSSGAALHGSPISGGYAGAKQTQRFLVQYAAAEAQAHDLGISFHALLPQLNPNTDLGRAAIAAYAARAKETPEGFVAKRFGPRPLSPEIAGCAVADLLYSDELAGTREFLLTGVGLSPVGN